jgi:hypothetical protein
MSIEIAWLRWFVSASDLKTSWLTDSGRPAKSLYQARIFFQISSRLRPADHARRRDRARIHHRVHLGALVPLDRVDGVEDLPRGVHAHVALDGVDALLLHDPGHGEDLGDRLDRDLGLDVPPMVWTWPSTVTTAIP